MFEPVGELPDPDVDLAGPLCDGAGLVRPPFRQRLQLVGQRSQLLRHLLRALLCLFGHLSARGVDQLSDLVPGLMRDGARLVLRDGRHVPGGGLGGLGDLTRLAARLRSLVGDR
jgi:hypothetical protein